VQWHALEEEEEEEEEDLGSLGPGLHCGIADLTELREATASDLMSGSKCQGSRSPDPFHERPEKL
jgi:hypothetical protein